MNMEDLHRLLRAGHAQAHGIVETVSDPVLLLDRHLCVQNASRAFLDAFKVERHETIGKPVYELGNGQWDIADLRLLLMQVIPRSAAVIDYRVDHDFPGLGHKTMLLTARTLPHSDSSNLHMLLSILDITDRAQTDAEKDMLFGELKHRMKNLLAVARSIARQGTTAGRSAAQYRDDFLGRFEALVEAQELGFSGDESTDLGTLVERVLSPYLPEPGAMDVTPGDMVILGASTLTSLGLVLHELSTNAAKYGALSVRSGGVSVGWTIDRQTNNLRITWIERGGPPVTAPTTTGFGSRLIRTAIARGRVTLDYAPGGLAAEILIPFGSAALPR